MTSSDAVIIVRTIVDLPDLERDQLDALCRQRGISRAEALREALRLWLEQQQPQHRQVFGLWRDRSDDALTIQDSLRQEWAGR
jgi:Arc/MetJ-type ribon-helix-helix transcriptional regulator